MTQQKRAREILKRLRKNYPIRGEFVHWKTPLELVVGTILSAQCTDKQVNKVTKVLFKKYKSAQDYANARLSTLEKEIYSTGFYRTKARHLKSMGQLLVRKFHGTIPGSFDELCELPGVSNKTAHLIMAKVFGSPTGVAVDTHVKRLAPRLGLTRHTDPKHIESDLSRLYEKKDYLEVNEYFIMHGRAVCVSKPRCSDCVVSDLCPFGRQVLGNARRAKKNRR